MQYNPSKALDRLDHNTPLMKKLIGLFIQDCPAYIERLQAACQSTDLQSLGKIAHSVKGSAGAIGLDSAQKLAEDLEVACRQSGVKSIASLENSTLKLIDVLRNCKEYLEQWNRQAP